MAPRAALRIVLVLIAAAVAWAAVPAARAQPLTVTGVDVAEGAGGVALRDTFHFTFSRSLPFNSFYTRKFRFEPRLKAFRRESFFGGVATIRYTIEHQPETDYAVYVYGVRAADGTAMARPFTRNYTTASAHGTRRASGTAAFSDGTLGKTGGTSDEPPGAGALRALVNEAFSDVQRAEAPAVPDRAPASTDLDRTVVVLLDAYSIDTQTWTVRAAATLDGAGAFAFAHVREGTYWPVAISFANEDGEVIGAYGFHDLNGDLAPDPITVGTGGVANLRVALLRDAPATARARLPRARNRAEGVAADARLVEAAAFEPATNGAARTWRFTYYAPAKDSLVVVDVGPVNTQTYVQPATGEARTQAAFPEPFIDSAFALSEAEANGGASFRAAHPGATLRLDGGDLPLTFRPVRPSRFWRVRYTAPAGTSPPDSLVVFIDLGAGQVLPGREVELPVELASFTARADGPGAAVLRWETASETGNAGWGVEVRQTAAGGWREVAFVAGAGTTAAPRAYGVRVEHAGAGRVAFRLRQVDLDGAHRYSAEVEAALQPGADAVRAWPNPARSAARVAYTLATPGTARLDVYNVLGQRVATLADGEHAAGDHEVAWDAAALPAGPYVLVLTRERGRTHRTVVVAR